MSRHAERAHSADGTNVGERAKARTPFAAMCRNLRRERDQLLKDQAAAFGTSIAYISAVETGRKERIPDEFIEKFISWLRLDDLTAERLRQAADDTRQVMTLRSASPAQARLLAVLGRSLEGLSRGEIEELRSRVLAMRSGKK